MEKFIKNCWNQRVSGDEYIEILHKNLDEQTIIKLGIYMTELCGKDYQPTKYFLECLYNTVKGQPQNLFLNIDLENKEHVLGTIRLLTKFGDDLFNSAKVGSEEAAKSACIALTAVLLSESTDIMTAALKKLTESHFFSILIASGRVFAKDDFLKLQKFASSKPSFMNFFTRCASISKPFNTCSLFQRD